MDQKIVIHEQYLSRKDLYDDLLVQIRNLIKDEPDLIANLANIAAVIKTYCGFFWAGFYFVNDRELVLGPFQGPVACTRIQYGQGVCGTAWKERKTIVVDDVNEFPGHIACSIESKSEIVVPIHHKGKVFMILDVDSDKPSDFKEADQHFFESLAKLIVALHK